ncbi:unnamed protein product [Didymodactylos carnosus]|uniref:Uncharacterized protein n=1 Tax=Didymodactylos carnosus TaxID=1234261 RepID=A0A814W7L1_9BILA|nr:unnamed protein product [Didymodactylos carnosus]CAF3962818.1 unnamed protein product [Didymodactylos carnosus]
MGSSLLFTLLIILTFTFMLTSSSPSLSGALRHIVRRQSDEMPCHVIDGFTCLCRQTKVTCSTSQPLQQITINPNEKHKYSSVELVVGSDSATVYGQTFTPIKELYSPTARHIDFKIKFENFTHLSLAEPSLFNNVFPDQSQAHKAMAYEIYNQAVRPEDNVNLFRNLDVDSLEVYSLYPFRGTFQELFDGSNIKHLRISGGDIKSDLNKHFTGNVGRLEIAKQAEALDAANFPLYPAHEMILNAYYVKKFHSPNPPNYDNVAELRVYSDDPIPADAFKDFPNINTLSVQAKEIDPSAFNGLNKLEKITIKDAQPNAALLQNIPSVKEVEIGGLEKLNPDVQCEFAQQLSQGRLAVQASPNGPECTCVIAYLQSATNQVPCTPYENCAQSTCQAIRDNFDTNTNAFNKPPEIRRADGTSALEHRSPAVYAQPYQLSSNDISKYQAAVPQEVLRDPYQAPEPSQSESRPPSHTHDQGHVAGNVDDTATVKTTRRRKTKSTTTAAVAGGDQWPQPSDQGQQGENPPDQGGVYPPDQGGVYPPGQGGVYPPGQGGVYPPGQGGVYPPGQGGAYPPDQGGAYPPDQGDIYPPGGDQYGINPTPSASVDDTPSTTIPVGDSQDHHQQDNRQPEQPIPPEQDHGGHVETTSINDGTVTVAGTVAGTPTTKKRMNMIPIYIIIAAVALAILALVVYLIVRSSRGKAAYKPAPQTDPTKA